MFRERENQNADVILEYVLTKYGCMKIVVILFIEANQSERKSKQVLISEAMTCQKTNIKKSQKDPFDRSAFDQKIYSLRKKIEDRKRKQSIEFCLYGYIFYLFYLLNLQVG